MVGQTVTVLALSKTDAVRLVELETVVSSGLKTFVDVGTALLEIRDARLYRVDFDTFEASCQKVPRRRQQQSRIHHPALGHH